MKLGKILNWWAKRQARNRWAKRHARKAIAQFHRSLPYTFEKLGTEYCGWVIPIDVIKPGGVAICVGAGEDISFDLAIARKYAISVHIIDPTPRAKAHVQTVLQGIKHNINVAINNSHADFYDFSGVSASLVKFHYKGFWGRNRKMRFYAPEDTADVSHSIMNLQMTKAFFEADCVTPEQFCADNDIKDVELMKLDIEGAEYSVIGSLRKSSIRPRILCIEFDEGHNPANFLFFLRMKRSLRDLKAAGYVLAYVDKWNLTFVLAPDYGGN